MTTRREHDLIQMIEAEGCTVKALEHSNNGHFITTLRNPANGRERKMTFAYSASDARAKTNQRADIRRFKAGIY